jgi:MOSC domain-containing protein YiiM
MTTERPQRARLVSLNVGQAALRDYDRGPVLTGGHKQPVAEAWLSAQGLAGDEQGDRQNHGGPDKAACVYAFDHYPYWEQVLGRALAPGVFSENLTLLGAPETAVAVGDVFRAGEALVQVSQPRVPCFKLANKIGRADAPELIHANGYSGYYLRVLAPGCLRPGDDFALEARDPAGVTIAFVNDVFYGHRAALEDFDRVLAAPALAARFRGWFERQRDRLGAQG